MVVTDEIREGVVVADRYRVRGRIGRGGMATVFLAEDCVLCRDVAIKRLHTAGSDVHARRFRREARIGASLMHPNLVTVFDTLSAPEGLLIVMEYVRGEPLSEMIGSEGLAPGRVIEIARPLASALDYAHENGVVHRDVKPANILIGDGGRVKLVDLGTATASNVGQITTESEVVGTLAYIAPERLAGDSVGEPPADVYALAVVVFEAFTGRKPYPAATPGELLAAADEGPPDMSGLSPQLGTVLEQGMHPDPERRQPSASALVSELESAVKAQVTPALASPATEPMTLPLGPEPQPPPPVPERDRSAPEPERPARQPAFQPYERRGARWPVPLALALCVLLAVGIWIGVSSGGSGSGGGSGGPRGPAAHRGEARTTRAKGNSPSASAAGSETSTSTAVQAAPTASGTDPAQLNDEGYALIQQGRYTEAIPILRRAVASFPPGTTDLTYAYALFNLGHALRMAGDPQAAIPILERRLRIPDQTETVRAELDAARSDAATP